MKNLVITGMDRDRAAVLAQSAAAGKLAITTASDYDGALALKRGAADYFVGICQSGAGGALALAIGVLGSTRCRTIAASGVAPVDAQQLTEAVDAGVVAFGVAVEHIDQAIPRLVVALAGGGE